MAQGSPAERKQRLHVLARIYADMALWGRDVDAVPRNMLAVNPCADLMIVGEATGPRTLRVSGVNYFDRYGKLGRTGEYLEEILRLVGFTLYPQRNVVVPEGVIKGASGNRLRTAYCTDLCPVFPGHAEVRRKNGIRTSIRRPPKELIVSAFKSRFLERELEVVKPRVILLLGAHAYRSFYTHFLGRSELPTLLAAVEEFGSQVAVYNTAVTVPFLHPSSASPMFQQWLRVFRRARTRVKLIKYLRTRLES